MPVAAACLVLSSAFLSPAAPIGTGGDTLDRVAEPFDGVRWSDGRAAADEEEGEVRKEVSSEKRVPYVIEPPDGGGLEAWAGRPVLLLQLPHDRGWAEELRFADDARVANLDRGLVVAVLLPDAEAAVTEDGAEAPEPSPVEEIQPEMRTGRVPADSGWSPTGGARAVVLGPSGEVVGSAALPAEEDDARELLRLAMLRYPAPRLSGPLPEPLEDAGALYFDGEWAKARKAAAKVARRAARRDPDLADRAEELVRSVDAFERDLRVRFVEEESSGSSFELESLARLAAAAERGFPRTDLGKLAKETPERIARAGARSGFSRITAWVLSAEYVELLEERPALFPLEANARGGRYAKKLSSLQLRTSSFQGDLSRKIRMLLMRYEVTKAQR